MDGVEVMRTLRARLAELGVDATDREVVLDLAAVGATWVAWRNGPVEDWHSRPGSCIRDAELARATVSVTRDVRMILAARKERVHAIGTLVLIAAAVADLDRWLPDGRTVGALAPDSEERELFVRFVHGAERRWRALATELGVEAVLQMLACAAGWRVHHWWSTPWWPARVARFLDRVESLRVESGDVQKRWHEPDALHRTLLLGLDHLDTRTVARCLGAGLGDPVSRFEPRVARSSFASLTALVEPDTPHEACARLLDEVRAGSAVA
jgi:hypothetical protein